MIGILDDSKICASDFYVEENILLARIRPG